MHGADIYRLEYYREKGATVGLTIKPKGERIAVSLSGRVLGHFENLDMVAGFIDGFDWWQAKNPNNIVSAAIKTLTENRHLCDGDDCTLRELRDAVEREFGQEYAESIVYGFRK